MKQQAESGKTQLQIDHDMFKESPRIYYSELNRARQSHFSNIINGNINTGAPFATADRSTNPPTRVPLEFASAKKCNEFACFFHPHFTIIGPLQMFQS